MSELQLALGLAVLSINLAAAVIGAISYWGDRLSVPFWYVLRLGQLMVLVQVIGELFFYLDGHRASDDLHYLYIVLPLVASLIAEATRAGAAQQELAGVDFRSLTPERQQQVGLAIVRRETGILALGAMVIAFLAWRGLVTSAGMF